MAEGTQEQPTPQGKGRDITTLVIQDIQEKTFLAPEKGMETVALWIRSAAVYLRSHLSGIEPALGDDIGFVAQALKNDLLARSEMGRQKYGEALRAFNGRNARLDCYQELLDAWEYSRQIQEENEVTK